MSDSNERADIRTRFKKGRSGNPRGRPKARKNHGVLLREVIFKSIRVKDGDGTRPVPKLIAAAEVCLNKALKGDAAAFMKIMTVVEKYKLLGAAPPEQEITEIRRVIVYPPKSKEAEEDQRAVDARNNKSDGSFR